MPEGLTEIDDPPLIAECHRAAEAFTDKHGIGDTPSGTREWGLFNTLARKCNGTAVLSAETIVEVMQDHGFSDVDASMMTRVEGRGSEQINLDLADKFAHVIVGEGVLSSEDTPADAKDKPAEPKSWRDGITVAKKGKGLDVVRNPILFLQNHHELKDRLSYDLFARHPVVAGPLPWNPDTASRAWTPSDDTTLAAWLQFQPKAPLVTSRTANQAVDVVAHGRPFHPVRDYLAAFQWDRVPRLPILLPGYFGADQEPAEYLAAVGTKWMISAVARIYEPGCQADHALIFEGLNQGERKSTALRILAVKDEWFSDGLPDDLASRSASLCLDGKWIIELSELSSMRRSDIEPTKAFITRRVEHYDPKFSNRTVDVPRQCVFAGTTNESEYLRDPTGNRRFWPVRCGAVDTIALLADRDQLWAEAVVRYHAAERWWIDPALEPDLAETTEAIQRSRLVTTSHDDDLADYLNGHMAVKPKPLASTTISEVFEDVYGVLNRRDRDPRIEQSIAARLKALGWRKEQTRLENGARQMRYFRPTRYRRNP